MDLESWLPGRGSEVCRVFFSDPDVFSSEFSGPEFFPELDFRRALENMCFCGFMMKSELSFPAAS